MMERGGRRKAEKRNGEGMVVGEDITPEEYQLLFIIHFE